MKQATALALLKQGKNVFITGQAGSGKTHLVNQYIDWLRRHAIEPAITASTGIAATHIGGTTIHSWSGMGINDTLTPELQDEILSRERTWKRIKNTKVLIIDEISMVAPNFLDAIDSIARIVHEEPDKAFGGIQVIFSGDFFQLPPVVRRRESSPRKRYAWQSRAWLDAGITPCYLSEQHRQQDSDALTRILGSIRSGDIEEDGLAELRERHGVMPEKGLEPVQLYTHNKDVDVINYQELEKIEADPHYFEMTSTGSKVNVEKLKQGCLAPELLELRAGARVMFVRNNYEKGYVNGSLGIVIGFDEHSEYPIVELYSGEIITASPEEWVLEQDGKKQASISQIPIRLAWAITIHKSQGMTLDAALIDLSKCFEVGQGYVALSRVRSIDGLYICGFNNTATEMDPLTIRVDNRFRELSDEYEATQRHLENEKQVEYERNWIEQVGGSIDEVDYETEAQRAKKSTREQTLELLRAGRSISEIAQDRGLAEGTIIGHLLDLRQAGEEIGAPSVDISSDIIDMVQEAVDSLEQEEYLDDRGGYILKPIFRALDGEVEYDDIKRALLFIRK
ncbi:MAG: helix-turn-helix domain-containing protein [Patescibacteria group bacterium]